MWLLLCPLDLKAQFRRINTESLGASQLSSGPNSAEGVTLVLSVEKGEKKSVPFHREKMPAQSIDHWDLKWYTFRSFPFHQTKYRCQSFRNRSVSLLSNLSPSIDIVIEPIIRYSYSYISGQSSNTRYQSRSQGPRRALLYYTHVPRTTRQLEALLA